MIVGTNQGRLVGTNSRWWETYGEELPSIMGEKDTLFTSVDIEVVPMVVDES